MRERETERARERGGEGARKREKKKFGGSEGGTKKQSGRLNDR